MCDELACRLSDCSERAGKLVALDNPETTVNPSKLMTTNKPPRTDENVQGNLLLDYEQIFANFPYYLQLTKLSSNVGVTKTVARRQYFTTLDDAELENLGGSCREHTLLRSDPLSEVKGWVRGNTKIGPALEVAVTHHQGHYGIETMIQSLIGDGTCSWVMIVNGINKYVTEMTEETQDDHIDHMHGRKFGETCCYSKTEANINTGKFFNDYVSIPPA